MADVIYDGADEIVVERATTGKRVLTTLFFSVITRLVEAVLAFVVLFELGYALVTKRPPNARVVRFANRLVRYEFEIGQFMTYNRQEPPFPFNDFPPETAPRSN